MSGTKSKVLIVDDEELLREILKEEFELAGFEVQEASNGRDAFVLISNGSFDAVVTDVRMPGGDGIELLQNVVKMGAGRPVVFMVTGFADLTEAKAVELGAKRLFTKPVALEEIVRSVSDSLKTSA